MGEWVKLQEPVGRTLWHTCTCKQCSWQQKKIIQGWIQDFEMGGGGGGAEKIVCARGTKSLTAMKGLGS